MSAGLIVSLRGRWSFSSPESSRNWPQQPSSSQDRARRRFRVVDTERSASSRVSTDGRRQSETVRARAREVGGGASSSPASENEPDAFRSRSGIIGRSGNVGGRGQGRTNGTASGDRGVGDAEHQMGDGGRFVGGGGGVWARGGGVARRALFLGEATSAADELGEGSGSTFRASCSGVQRSASGACPATPSSACPATRNIEGSVGTHSSLGRTPAWRRPHAGPGTL